MRSRADLGCHPEALRKEVVDCKELSKPTKSKVMMML